MLETIAEYWVVWACGIVAAGLVFFIKRLFKLEREKIEAQLQKDREQLKTNIIDKIEDEIQVEVSRSNTADTEIRANIEVIENSLENLSKGILAVQGKEFKAECRALLEPGHVITLEEYEQIVEDHDAYHALGGNHKGDALFASVEQKWNGQLIN